MFVLHEGDDYITMETPGGAMWMIRHCDKDDLEEARKMVEVLNASIDN